MNVFRALAIVAAAATLAAGCSGSGLTPSPPTAEQLSGSWNLSSLTPAGQAEQTTPAGATYALTLTNDRVSARADCNSCAGGFALSGQTLTVGPALACTQAACPTAAFESNYTSILSGDSVVAVTADKLTLSSARGVLRFAR